MGKQYQQAVFIFRRDLRLFDNTALNAACRESESVLPCFIFDPRQVHDHPYRSLPGQHFLFASLKELEKELERLHGRLYRFYGEAPAILEKLLLAARAAGNPIQAVYLNRDYTPFSRNRDKALAKVCEQHSAALHLHGDALLQEPESVAKEDGTPYTVYSPFAKRASKLAVRSCESLPDVKFVNAPFAFEEPAEIYTRLLPTPPSSQLLLRGGRSEALTILKSITRFARYDDERNFPAILGTTTLSTHHKFGTVSAREVYHAVSAAFGPAHTLIRELLWRDFFHHIGFHFPHVFLGAFQKGYDALAWSAPDARFTRWCEGTTGFPLVDAGMRELAHTGYMHNRVRMVVASFLTKDLQISWREGEKFFARSLLDYDPCVNNGNWQWASSTGCDAQPYFRIFNPWLQQQKFDPDCMYIKRWVPELQSLPADAIHGLAEGEGRPANYPAAMVDHQEAKEVTLNMFSLVRDAQKK